MESQTPKPKNRNGRSIQTLYMEGADGSAWRGEGQIEKLGDDRTAAFGQSVQLAHHFDRADLELILAFKTAERTQAFVKEL